MPTNIEEKLSDFMYSLFTIASSNPSAIEAFKGYEMVVEIKFADCPKANFQVEANKDKLIIHKGTPKKATIILEYVTVETCKNILEGRMPYLNALLMNNVLLPRLGANDEIVFFLDSMERPLKIAWMTLRSEFPGLPTRVKAPQTVKRTKPKKKTNKKQPTKKS